MTRIDLGIIGGSGFYNFFEQSGQLETPTTEFGTAAGPVTLAEWGGRSIGFLPRHGLGHAFLPHQVPYAANLAALRDLGAGQIFGFNLVGSLSPKIGKGDFVFVDQFIDMTWGRKETIFDGAGGAHADLAEPFCATMRKIALDAVADTTETVHPHATALVINGPKFQTKAESKLYHAWGAEVINMTMSTEAALARELELCYMNLSYCTDYGVLTDETNPHADDEPVLHSTIIQEFTRNMDRVEQVVDRVVTALADTPDCACRTAMEGCRV
jgi:5'-methylthioadenosine phosphorylase